MADLYIKEVEGGEFTGAFTSNHGLVQDDGTTYTWFQVLKILAEIYESGGQILDVGAIADGDFIRRSGTDLLGRSYAEARGDLTEVNVQTGTTYTTAASDDGKIITLNNGSAITLTVLDTAPAGFHCFIVQKGAGQVTVAAGGTGNIRNYDSLTKLAGQYAVGTIFVESNAGTAPEVYLGGRTA